MMSACTRMFRRNARSLICPTVSTERPRGGRATGTHLELEEVSAGEILWVEAAREPVVHVVPLPLERVLDFVALPVLLVPGPRRLLRPDAPERGHGRLEAGLERGEVAGVEELLGLVEAVLQGPEHGVERVRVHGLVLLRLPLAVHVHLLRRAILGGGVPVEGGDILDVVLAPQVHRALVPQRKALEHEDEDPAAEGRVEGSGQAAEELVAGAQDDQLLLLEVLRRDALATRLEKVKDLAAAGDGLAVEQLLDEPEQERGVA